MENVIFQKSLLLKKLFLYSAEVKVSERDSFITWALSFREKLFYHMSSPILLNFFKRHYIFKIRELFVYPIKAQDIKVECICWCQKGKNSNSETPLKRFKICCTPSVKKSRQCYKKSLTFWWSHRRLFAIIRRVAVACGPTYTLCKGT